MTTRDVNHIPTTAPRPPRGAQALLLLFARYPVAGQSKTRLIPALGPAGAAAAHRELTEFTVRVARGLTAARPDIELHVRFTGGTDEAMAAWLGSGDDSVASPLRIVPQGSGDLGDRLSRAFAEAFASGCRAVVAIGSDCPSATPAHLTMAFDALSEAPAVLGPATDGGYYLIGLSRSDLVGEAFRQIDWGTDRVLDQTLHRLRAVGVNDEVGVNVGVEAEAATTEVGGAGEPPGASAVAVPNVASAGGAVVLLEALSDVDRPEDLLAWFALRDSESS